MGKALLRIMLVGLAAGLCLATTVLADDELDAEQTEPPPPSGPTLQPADYTPLVCDPAASGMRFLEVRGTGFDAWSLQRLVGNVVDAQGTPQMQWGSIWVSPRGRLTLEVNLCADASHGRPALPAGTYTVAVRQASGPTITATSIALSSPEPPTSESDEDSL